MSESRDYSQLTVTFPSAIVSRIDVARLIQAIELCDQRMVASEMRRQGGISDATQTADIPEVVQSFLAANQLTMGASKERQALLRALEQTKKSLPVIHVTFAAEVTREVLEQVVIWLRTHIHPQAVVEAGVQPALIAGVYVRTTNQVYDFSLRGALQGGRSILKKEIGALRSV